MSLEKAQAFKNVVPARTREYIDALHEHTSTTVSTDLAEQNKYMKAQRDDFDKQIAEMNARIRKMEDILNFQIGSRRDLLDLIDYLNEMEEKKRS